MTHQKSKKATSINSGNGDTSSVQIQSPLEQQLETASPLIVVTSGKGGVGKTLESQVAQITLQGLGHEVLCVDADGSNSSLARQLPEAHLLEGTNGPELLASLEKLLLEQCLAAGKSLVVDTGGGFDRTIRSWFASEDVTNILNARGIQVVSVTVIDSSLDSAGHVMENIDSMRGAHHVIVMNLGHVPGSLGERAFKPLFDNEEFAAYVKQAQLVVMPRLQDAIEIDAIGARLHSITKAESPAATNPFLVSRTKTWLEAVTSDLSKAFATDLPINC